MPATEGATGTGDSKRCSYFGYIQKRTPCDFLKDTLEASEERIVMYTGLGIRTCSAV